METISLWSSHFEGILWILSRIPLDSLRTLTWPTQTIHFTITDSTHLQFSCSGLSNRHERRKRQSPSEKGKKSHPLHIPDLPIRGQPSIYFPIRDHVNVSWCRSHTNASGVISTSHIVASHITKLLLSFRQILQFRFWDNPQGRIPPWKVTKNKAISVHVLWGSFRHRSTPVLWSSNQKINFLHYISVTAVKYAIVPVQRNTF